jgi:hypothetical protein
MTVRKEKINRELYGFLKSHGYKPQGFLGSGESSGIPEKADFFQFDFMYDGKNYGKVSVSIDGNGNLIIYSGDDVENSPKANSHNSISFTSLKRYLSRFRHTKGLKSFQLSDTDDLEPDMKKREHDRTEGLNEGYYPINKRSSYNDSVPTTKIILQHSRVMEEGDQRFRSIEKIFVENVQGERFLLPTNKPGLARVYARHISEGGTPYDERGQHITSLCEEYAKMAGFVRATKNKQFNESAQSLINEGINHYNSLRETLHKMSGKRGYTEYFNNYKPALTEDDASTDISEMFMQTSLDPRIESVMPILGKLSKNISENKLKPVEELEEWADKVIEGRSDEMDDEYDPESDDYAERQAEKADFERDLDKEQGVAEGMEGRVVFSGTGANGAKYEIIQSGPTDFMIHANGKHIDTYSSLQRAMSVLKNEVPGLTKGVAEESHKIAGRHDPAEFDAMVKRVGQKAKQNPADIQALAKKLHAAMKADEKKEKEVKEAGPAGKPGDYFDTETVKTGPVLGNKPQTQHGLRGKLVGEGQEDLEAILRIIKK